jgi:hypothetical protein
MTAIDNETAAAASLDRSLFLGEWHNTNPEGSIARIAIRDSEDGRLWVESTGRLRDGSRDWGRVEGHVYAFQFDDSAAGAFDAKWDLGFMEIRMQANVKAGVLVVVTLNHFRDASGRSSYFDREFYHRVGP